MLNPRKSQEQVQDPVADTPVDAKAQPPPLPPRPAFAADAGPGAEELRTPQAELPRLLGRVRPCSPVEAVEKEHLRNWPGHEQLHKTTLASLSSSPIPAPLESVTLQDMWGLVGHCAGTRKNRLGQ
mmetsp:Transcript_104377/g.332066  ORF Transcript_104377/g.332066 Transcript_104377/m.332066 type:complete len:126 (+) Transcript_104377:585-962(+)